MVRFVSQHLEGAVPASSSNAHERFLRRTISEKRDDEPIVCPKPV